LTSYAAEFQPQTLIDGRYEVSEVIGEGAYGAVYAARDQELGRDVAVKVLNVLAVGEWGEERKQRFAREAKALSVLRHSSIVAVHRIGLLADGRPYMVMERAPGTTLNEFIAANGPLSCNQATALTIELAEALAHAHANGVIHRDIKPQNIIISNAAGESHAMLVDFGLSSLEIGGDIEQSKITRTGAIIGTPQYMSPEQCRGARLDERSDIYSLACVYFEMLAGKPACSADDPATAFFKQINEPLPNLCALDPSARFPKLVQHIIDKATAKDRDERYENMNSMLEDLNRLSLQRSGARFNALKLDYKPKRSSKWIIPMVASIALLILFATVIVAGALLIPAAQPALVTQITTNLPAIKARALLLQIARLKKQIGGNDALVSFAVETVNTSAVRTWELEDRSLMDWDMLQQLVAAKVEPSHSWPVAFTLFKDDVDVLAQRTDVSPEFCKILTQCVEYIRSSHLSRAQWVEMLHTTVPAADSIRDRHCRDEQAMRTAHASLVLLNAEANVNGGNNGWFDVNGPSATVKEYVGLAGMCRTLDSEEADHYLDLAESTYKKYLKSDGVEKLGRWGLLLRERARREIFKHHYDSARELFKQCDRLPPACFSEAEEGSHAKLRAEINALPSNEH
jgi:hypothetical protein